MPFISQIARVRHIAIVGVAGVVVAACQSAQAAKASSDMGTAAPQQPAWRSLFDGRSLAAWRGYRQSEVPAEWKVVDGTFMKEAPTEDLISRDQFGDFELEFEWKVSQGGNAGVFYRATEEYEKIYWSATEYQLLDDANARDGRSPLTSAGANYGLYPATPGVVKPANEWNSSRIVARGSHVEHWLNGRKLLEYDYGSPDWEAKVKASKFKDWPNYGRAKTGHIGIQGDHGGMLAFRNVRIRELK